jgi:hypothetical protein
MLKKGGSYRPAILQDLSFDNLLHFQKFGNISIFSTAWTLFPREKIGIPGLAKGAL